MTEERTVVAPTLEAALAAAGLARVGWRPFRLPMRHRFEAAHGALEDREGVVVVLETADGRSGLGEASPLAAIGGGTVADVVSLLEAHAGALLAGTVPADLDHAPGVQALRCGLDTALLDLEGQAAGVPIARLLNEGAAEAVTVNAVIGGGPPGECAAFGREAVEHGFHVVKLKVGVGQVEDDVARVRALREACPTAMIRLDANGAWSEEEAAQAIRGFYPLRVELLEQPVPAGEVEALLRIRSTAPLRIAADESLRDPEDAERVIDLRASDLLVLKPMVLGGPRSALGMAQRGARRGIGAFATTTFDSSIGTAMAAHLAAALPTDAAHGLATGEHLGADLVREPLLPAQGWLAVPSGAGLGVELDPEALEALATGPWSERRA